MYYAWLTFVIPMVRAVLIGHIIIILIASGLWIASIHVPEPNRQALIWIAIIIGPYTLHGSQVVIQMTRTGANVALDVWGALVLLFLMRGSHHVSEKFGLRMKKLFEFYPGRLPP